MKPILRVSKIHASGRSTLRSVAGHLARISITPNADPNRTDENVWLVGGPDLEARHAAVLDRAKIDRAKLRADAVLANDIVLSISPEWFRPGQPDEHGQADPERLALFRKEAEGFLREQFGARLIGAVLHTDEATPHVQAVVVPLAKKEGGGYRLTSKETFGPAQLTALQDAWEARLRPYGVGPRLRGSRARHTRLKAYYGSVEAAPAIPELVPSPPPPAPFLEGQEARQRRLDGWQQQEAQKARKRLKPLAAAAAKGALYEAERTASSTLREDLSAERRGTGRLREMVTELDTTVELAKDQVARLRGLPVNQVALALGWEGETAPRENAIDLVKRAGELDYKQAVAWLHHTFGADAAASAVSEHARAELASSPPPPVQTAAEKVKAKSISQQLAALGAPAYRVTIMRQVGSDQVGQNLGKQPDGEPERFFTARDILGSLPLLTSHNARGGNVFITPVDQTARHILLDDLDTARLAELRQRGYRPALVQETSPGRLQAVLKVSADLDEHASNELFKQLNRELGDPKITGLSHPFRLAGFQNRKPKYEHEGRYPFVRVLEATGAFCARARSVITTMAQQLTQERGALPLAASGARRA